MKPKSNKRAKKYQLFELKIKKISDDIEQIKNDIFRIEETLKKTNLDWLSKCIEELVAQVKQGIKISI